MKRSALLIGGLAVALTVGGVAVVSSSQDSSGTPAGPGAVTSSRPGGTAVTRPASNLPAVLPFPVTVSIAGLNPAPMGATMTVRVAASTTAPVRAVALYDGSRLVGSAPVPTGTNAASFQILADDPGIHSFVGRALAGSVSSSTPAAVSEYAPHGATDLTVASLSGETQAQAAARLGAPWVRITLPSGATLDPASSAALGNGALLRVHTAPAPGSPLQSGASSLAGPAPNRSAPPAPSVDPRSKTPPTTIELIPTVDTAATAKAAKDTAADSASPGPTTAPWTLPFGSEPDPGPTISVALQGCAVTVSTTAADRVSVLQASATTGGFVVSGEVEPAYPMTVSDLPAGQWLFEGEDGFGTSAPTAVQIPDTCDPAWQGTVAIRHGLLVLPQPAANVYLYAGVDDKPFVRIPAEDGEFLHAPTTSTPISPQLPQLRGQHLVLQAWRQNGAGASLIGRGELELPAGWSMDDAVGLPGTLTLDPVSGHAPDGTVDAQWGKRVALIAHTDSTVAQRLGYQVLSEPLTPANHDLAPLGLLASGDAGLVSSTGTAVFSLDWATLPRAKAAGGRARVFVRVIAFNGANGVLPMASRVLVIVLPKVTQPPGPIPLNAPTVASLSVVWPHVPNPKLANCAEVHVPWKGNLPQPNGPFASTQAADEAGYAYFGSHVYPTSGRYCVYVVPTGDDNNDDPGICDVPIIGDFCDAGEAASSFAMDLVDAAATVWDWVAAAYNGVVAFVENVMAEFNPICLAAKLASSSLGSDCSAVAKLVSTAVVTAVLESYGLPAQLPTSADIADIAKGDLKELAVQYMQSLGIPCDELKADGDAVAAADQLADHLHPGTTHHYGKDLDICGEVAGLVTDTMKNQIIAQQQANVASAIGLTYFPVPGFSIEPEPAAQLQPLRLTVSLTGGHPKPSYACPFTIHFDTPDSSAKPLYRDTSGIITGSSPHQAIVVADQLNLSNVRAESKYVGLPIEVTVRFDHTCVENAGTRKLYGILEPALQ